MKQGLLLAFGVMLAAPSLAVADCMPPKPPRIDVAAVEAPLTQDRSLKIAALSKLDRGPPLPGLEGYDYALGVTETVLKTRAEAHMEGVVRGPEVCAFFTSVTVALNWQLFVRLAHEIEAGTCIDREVQRHEQGHVDLARRLIPTIRERLAEAVRKAAAKGASAANFDAAKQALWDRMSRAIDQTNAKSYAVLKARQAALDTPAEYASLPKACGRGELQALIRKSLD